MVKTQTEFFGGLKRCVIVNVGGSSPEGIPLLESEKVMPRLVLPVESGSRGECTGSLKPGEAFFPDNPCGVALDLFLGTGLR